MVSEDLRRRALEVWERAYARQMQGDLEQAIRLYQESLAIHPTAEAHTFLGWTYSFQGRIDEAIQECHNAIAVDPDYGNPYNDIGVYLMQKGDLDGAIPWLEKAKQAPRYEPRQFPYMNLGRIYLRRGQWTNAMREFEEGVRVAPKDQNMRKLLHELRARFN
ncbi:MAG TPA: tetratricopeptide repeat protein [Candidatus Methylomirabilis sp.]|nr:tetratricopeptide repeat protein [Candidatus Methylomirabilis sp.]